MEINLGESRLIQNPNQVYHDSTLIGKGTKESPLKTSGILNVVAKVADFTADGPSGTIYAMDGTDNAVTATLEDSAIGTQYTFLAVFQDFQLVVRPATNHTIRYNDFSGGGQTATDAEGINLAQTAAVVTVLKTGATTWFAINSNLIEPES